MSEKRCSPSESDKHLSRYTGKVPNPRAIWNIKLSTSPSYRNQFAFKKRLIANSLEKNKSAENNKTYFRDFFITYFQFPRLFLSRVFKNL